MSLGSKNNNSSGFSGYINSNSNSKSTAEKIQENLKEIKFIPIIFTVCPNRNNSDGSQTVPASTFPTAMTTQERPREEKDGNNSVIPNICQIQPIINIESQILAVMQHYNKKYAKEIKEKKQELTKQKAEAFDAEDKKDQNRAETSGQNESGQTNDKGDTTNSNEKKDSKEGQKTSEQLNIFNQDELIDSIEEYVRAQLQQFLLKNIEKMNNENLDAPDKARSQIIANTNTLNKSANNAESPPYQ